MNNAYITPEQVESIEAAGKALYRAHENDLAVSMLALALRLRGQLKPSSTYSSVYACDIDESAGMAEVVELRGYSRKVVCD